MSDEIKLKPVRIQTEEEIKHNPVIVYAYGHRAGCINYDDANEVWLFLPRVIETKKHYRVAALGEQSLELILNRVRELNARQKTSPDDDLTYLEKLKNLS